jgi:hypothetical protein
MQREDDIMRRVKHVAVSAALLSTTTFGCLEEAPEEEFDSEAYAMDGDEDDDPGLAAELEPSELPPIDNDTAGPPSPYCPTGSTSPSSVTECLGEADCFVLFQQGPDYFPKKQRFRDTNGDGEIDLNDDEEPIAGAQRGYRGHIVDPSASVRLCAHNYNPYTNYYATQPCGGAVMCGPKCVTFTY